MPRPAKPYLCRGWYVSNLGGKRHRLCPEADGLKAARDALLRLQQEVEGNGGRPFPSLSVVELVALFLDSVKVERSHHTYLDYQRWLAEFVRVHGHRQARDIARHDAQQFRNGIANGTWVRNRQSPRPYKPKTVNHAVIALKRCWNWAIQSDLLPARNPFDKMPLLHAEGRQRVMTDAEFQALLRHSSDSCFRRVLIALRYTSARPGEVRNLTWAQVDWENHRWVLHRHKSSRTARVSKPKIVPMCLCVEKLLRWLHRRNGHQPFVFLNSVGQPWTKDAFVQRMDSLRQRAGIVPDENGEHLVLYHHRHTYLTRAAATLGISGPMFLRVAEGLRPQRPGK
jgi:integrase